MGEKLFNMVFTVAILIMFCLAAFLIPPVWLRALVLFLISIVMSVLAELMHYRFYGTSSLVNIFKNPVYDANAKKERAKKLAMMLTPNVLTAACLLVISFMILDF